MGGRDQTLVLLEGLVCGILATVLWGSFALFYHPLSGVYVWNLLFYRIIVSEIFLVFLIIVTGRYKRLYQFVKSVPWRYIFMMALILGCWWFVFIWGVLTDRVNQVALGYFISPLISVAVAHFVFKESLSPLKYVSIVIAFLGIIFLVIHEMSVGTFPWISLAVGGCFSLYAVMKKHVPGDDAVMMQFLEVSVLFPIALALLFLWLPPSLRYQWFVTPHLDFFMISLGVISVLPLWGFSIASHKLPLLWTSFLQFIPPIGNFILGTFVFHEVLVWQEKLVFVCVWVSIMIFLLDAFRSKSARR